MANRSTFQDKQNFICMKRQIYNKIAKSQPQTQITLINITPETLKIQNKNSLSNFSSYLKRVRQAEKVLSEFISLYFVIKATF